MVKGTPLDTKTYHSKAYSIAIDLTLFIFIKEL